MMVFYRDLDEFYSAFDGLMPYRCLFHYTLHDACILFLKPDTVQAILIPFSLDDAAYPKHSRLRTLAPLAHAGSGVGNDGENALFLMLNGMNTRHLG